jgi:general secretion pathway protein D
MLQLKDGENQVLAGLIKNEDRSSSTKLPGIGDFPILGRLFGSQQDTRNKTEVVLSITPHLIRNVQRPPASTSEFSAGTEASFRRRPDSGGRGTVQMPGQGVRAAPGATPVPNTLAPLPVTPAPAPAPGGMVPATSVGGTATLPSAPPSVPASDLPVAPPVQITPLPPPDVTPIPQPAPTQAPIPAAHAAFPNQQ